MGGGDEDEVVGLDGVADYRLGEMQGYQNLICTAFLAVQRSMNSRISL